MEMDDINRVHCEIRKILRNSRKDLEVLKMPLTDNKYEIEQYENRVFEWDRARGEVLLQYGKHLLTKEQIQLLSASRCWHEPPNVMFLGILKQRFQEQRKQTMFGQLRSKQTKGTFDGRLILNTNNYIFV